MCNATDDFRLDIAHFFSLLALECSSVMVEGGAAVISSFLETMSAGPEERKQKNDSEDKQKQEQASSQKTLFDQLVVTIAPTLIGGYRCTSSLLPNSTRDGQTCFPRLESLHYTVLGSDIVLRGDCKKH